MAKLASLYVELFNVCVNGVIPNLKLVTALTNLHASQPIYHSKENILSWGPTAGGKLRMVASMFRDVAQDEGKRTTCLAKAWVL